MTTVRNALFQRQLYTMRKDTLQQRFFDYHSETGNDEYTIQAALAVMIRNGLSTEDFSFLAKELICEIFLTSESIHKIRLSCVYFRDYFTDEQWKTVVDRLFVSPNEFEQLTASTELYIRKLRPRLISGAQPTAKKTNMISYFKDANGKRHSWNLSNVNPDITKEEHYALVSILSTLDIFQKEGVRRFAEPIYADFMIYEPSFDRRDEESAANLLEKAGHLLPLDASLAMALESSDTAIETQNEDENRNEEEPLTDSTDVDFHEDVLEVPEEKTLDSSVNDAPPKEEAPELDDFYTAGFDPSTVSEDEQAEITFRAALEKRPMRDVQQDMEKEKTQAQEPASSEEQPVPKKKLSRRERRKLARELNQKNQQKNQQNKKGILGQLTKNGKKRK